MGFAALLADDAKWPAISGTSFDPGVALADERRDILPPFVVVPHGGHVDIRADASQEQDGWKMEIRVSSSLRLDWMYLL